MSKIPPNHHISKYLTLNDDIFVEAVNKFGTPLYLYDADLIKKIWNTLHSFLPKNITTFYSAKANPNVWIINVFRKLGASCEVASLGELIAALRAGISPSNIIFIGPGKSRYELDNAISHNLAAIVVESRREIEDVQILSKKQKCRTRVALRINPGRGRGSISMGGTTQFGMEIRIALDILKNAHRFVDIEIGGLHAYLGTGILEWEEVLTHTKMILQAADHLQHQSGQELTFIDIGGGFGIPYYDRDEPTDWSALSEPLKNLVNEYLAKHPQTETVAVESGRFLIGPAGVFLASVLDIKRMGDTWFVILNGGINVFGGEDYYRGFRPTPIRVVSHVTKNEQPVTLCGPLCTSADRLATDILLPMPEVEDIIAFYQAGAYRYTASPGLFLSHGFPCEVMVDNGHLFLIRERILPEQFLSGQPQSLEIA